MTKIELLKFYGDKIKQGVMPAADEDGSCFYRESSGRRQCAVGVLIPDSVWADAFGSAGVNYSNAAAGCRESIKRRTGFDVCGAVEGMDVPTLAYVQAAHDKAAVCRDFRRTFFGELRGLAFFADVPAELWEELTRDEA